MNSEKGVAVNIDGDILNHIYCTCGRNVNNIKNILAEYVAGYAKGGISDLLFCCFCQNSLFPTDVLSWRGDKLRQKTGNGAEVDYSDIPAIRSVVDIYAAMDEDPIAFMLGETRKYGIHPWLSVRMNDAHFGKSPIHWIHGDLYYEAKEKGMMIGDVTGQYYAACFDYGTEYIRDKMFAYLCECVDKYDVDGLELDFMREIFCFDYKKNPDCYKVMTELVSRVRAYLRRKEKERGRSIRLAVRLCRDIEDNKVFGFDAAEWVRRGLVDVLIPSPRWTSTDSDMPIDKWKAMTEGTGVEIWAGLETYLSEPYLQSTETVKGFAAQYFDAGADRIYLYNYFRWRSKDMAESDFEDKEDFEIYQKSLENDAHVWAVWSACESAESTKKGTRRHVVTYQENCTKPYREGEYRPLPMCINGEARISIQTGESKNKKVTLFVGVRQGDAAPAVTVDGTSAPCIGETFDAYCLHPRRMSNPEKKMYADVDFYAYSITPSRERIRNIVLVGDGATVKYLEIKVEDNGE